MTQEEKELLIKDLCARLQYGVKIKTPRGIYTVDAVSSEGLFSIPNSDKTLDDLTPHDGHYWLPITDDYKPYLRPMSSMTEEEITEIYEFARPYIIEEIKHGAESDNPDRKVEIENGFLSNAVIVDELNKRHFDYRGLIPMGLALPAEEGMYKNI